MMHDEQLKSLYRRLLAQRPAHADVAGAHAIGRALRADAEALSASLAAQRAHTAGGTGSRAEGAFHRPAVRWALAAAVALAAVFAAGRVGQDAGRPAGVPAQDPAELIANAEAPEPLFSASFEPARDSHAESIFDNDFGS